MSKEKSQITSARISARAVIISAIIGVAGIVIGAILSPLVPKWINQSGTDLPSVQSISCDEYGIKIVTPQNHADVPIEFELSGTYDKQSPDGYVLVYLAPPDHKSFWPQSAVEFDMLNKTWKAQVVMLGDPATQTLEGDYLVVLVGRSGRLYYDYFWRASRESGHWVYFEDLTEDTAICAQVSVKRTK